MTNVTFVTATIVSNSNAKKERSQHEKFYIIKTKYINFSSSKL